MDTARRVLILLRHAKSDWSGDEPDHDRPLSRRGRRQAPEAGRWLAEHVDHIDLAVVSTAVRARQTWELVSAPLAAPPSVRLEDRVYAASASALLEVVQTLPDDATTVVLVGHNPGIEHLASTLTGHWVSMPTSAFAVIGFSGGWGTAGSFEADLLASGRPPEEAPS